MQESHSREKDFIKMTKLGKTAEFARLQEAIGEEKEKVIKKVKSLYVEYRSEFLEELQLDLLTEEGEDVTSDNIKEWFVGSFGDSAYDISESLGIEEVAKYTVEVSVVYKDNSRDWFSFS